MTRDDRSVVAADPDFDRVFVADLEQRSLRRTVQLRADDEPGRVVEGRDGVVYVALRSAGELAEIDTWSGALLSRIPVCPAPRGVAYDAVSMTLHVACAGGELVSLDARDRTVLRSLRLADDLRDVVIVGDTLWVSRFRDAEVIVLNREGAVDRTMRPPWASDGSEARVAWRMIPWRGGAAMLHQRAGVTLDTLVSPGTTGYNPSVPTTVGSSCFVGITPAQVTMFLPGAPPVSTPWISHAMLPIDVAALGRDFFVVSASRFQAFSPTAPALLWVGIFAGDSRPCTVTSPALELDGPVAVAASVRFGLVAQTREPAELKVNASNRQTFTIRLSGALVGDAGHDAFHLATYNSISCASCHPEGGSDGHAWLISGQGLRRTPDLRGGLLATAPFHWDGSLPTMRAFVEEVFVRRMGGFALDNDRVAALGAWLDALPLTPRAAPLDIDAVHRGRVVFERSDTGCAGCHSGPHMTNNATVNVGTGAAFQVPSLLGLGRRAPYMHDGCATTVRDCLGACGGGERHGHTAQLTRSELHDLVAWLESL